MFVLFIALLIAYTPIQSDTLELSSGIESVTVFKNRAQIDRTISAQLTSGTTTLIFTGLSPSLIKESIQLKGDGAYTLLSMTSRYDFTEERVERNDIQRLREQKAALENDLMAKQAEREVIESEIRMLNSTQNIINNNKLSSAEISQLLTLYRENLSKLLTDRISTDKKISELRERIDLISRQINESGSVIRTRYAEVVAEIESNRAHTLNFELSYLVRDAGWNASYDLRTMDVDSPLSITYKANIYQNTGTDWEDVKFTINSGDPSSNSTKPEIGTTFVGYTTPVYRVTRRSTGANITVINQSGVVTGMVTDAQTGEQVPGASVLITGLNRGSATDADGRFRITNVPNGSYVMQVSFVGYSISNIPFTISNNGINAVIPLDYGAVGLDELVVSGYAVQPQSEVQLRGNAAVEAAKEPLYIVNGIPIDRGRGNIINSLDPDEIESIEVLKNNEAMSLYGEEASGGAIIVTTKTGVGATEISDQTSISYEIDTPYSVPSDDKEHTVVIKKEDAETIYQFSAAPKLSEYAYLEAELPSWNQLNLLPGSANIYFDNRYIGTTFLNSSSIDDTLSVSLGKDERIVIERRKLNEFSSKNFFRSRVTEYHSFEISIRNTKSEALIIEVQENIPVTTNEEIGVAPKELSGGQLNKQTGIVTWNLELEPGETKILRLDFEIGYPKGKKINF